MKKQDTLVSEYLSTIQTEIIDPVTLTAISAASLALSAVRLYKDHFTKAARQCADLPQNEKTLCLMRAKTIAKISQSKKLKGSIMACSKTKKPDECKQKLLVKAKKIDDEIRYLNSRVQVLRKQSYNNNK